ncbi:hypothetical protein GGR53DRAFT_527884 [Hypoxylon sp. FL1150]|nr:hypothetical protein GGR53DRAFT_527884 [Hypoxylon sp. FL1150]
MAEYKESEIISDNPIGDQLEEFLKDLAELCATDNVSCFEDLNVLGTEHSQITSQLFAVLEGLAACSLLRSNHGHGSLQEDIRKVADKIDTGGFSLKLIRPLFEAVIEHRPDEEIWARLRGAVKKLGLIPSPREPSSSVEHVGWFPDPNDFSVTVKYRRLVQAALKGRMCPMYVGLRDFDKLHFGEYRTAAEAVFARCKTGAHPVFKDGWIDYPPLNGKVPLEAGKRHILDWFRRLVRVLSAFAHDQNPTAGAAARKLVAQPSPHGGTLGRGRKFDFGFARKAETGVKSEILVPGKLKGAVAGDKFQAWFSMQVWKFDRLGGVASEQFDINEDGLRFVSIVIGFLWMSEEQLGLDSSVITSSDQSKRYIEIERNGVVEKIYIDEVIQRAPGITGRGSTCWKAHAEGRPQHPLGKLLQEATENGVVHVVRHYHDYVVSVSGVVDDIQHNIRKGLEIEEAENYQSMARRPARKGRGFKQKPNRLHRRIILADYGKPIHRATSLAALLDAFDACIEGHKSLYEAGILHRDISINNLMINEEATDPARRAFLIDLDMASKWEEKDDYQGMIGTVPYMSIGVLLGDEPTFYHDLESFFWVLFLICVQYKAPGQYVGNANFNWSSEDDELWLATRKVGLIADDKLFARHASESFTTYYKPLAGWMNQLRGVVFPKGRSQRRFEAKTDLYDEMQKILRHAQEDPRIREERLSTEDKNRQLDLSSI